jgi:glycosyltransferase involved in cell wall biosynthesis
LSDASNAPIRLSICIGTYNREQYIRATLDSVMEQLEDDCEIVVSDNASTDRTRCIVQEYAGRCNRVRYFRNETNLGIDRNFDNAVEQANGEYCWLMSDDDVLKPGAIRRVLLALQHATSVVIANVEYRDLSMSRTLQRRAVDCDSDRLYGPAELNRQFAELAKDQFVAFIGNVIVRRDLWKSRNPSRYFGSLLIHVGIVYQSPLPAGALLIAEPLVSVRVGNVHAFSAAAGEVLFDKWPKLLASLSISQAARRCAPGAEPARAYTWLLKTRALGFYSAAEYRHWIRPHLGSLRERLIPALIARAPFTLVNRVLTWIYLMRPNGGRFLYGFREALCSVKRQSLSQHAASSEAG